MRNLTNSCVFLFSSIVIGNPKIVYFYWLLAPQDKNLKPPNCFQKLGQTVVSFRLPGHLQRQNMIVWRSSLSKLDTFQKWAPFKGGRRQKTGNCGGFWKQIWIQSEDLLSSIWSMIPTLNMAFISNDFTPKCKRWKCHKSVFFSGVLL